MAQRVDVQYVQYYTSDNTARRVMPTTAPYLHPSRPVTKRKIKRIYVDPVAALGIVVAACMMIMMAAGVSRLREESQKSAVMADYVASLEVQNQQLQEEYAASYNLEDVEKTALALGMIPAAEAKHTTVTIETVQPQQEPTLWNRISSFWTGLFA